MTRRSAHTYLLHLLVLVILVIYLLPLGWIVLTSVKPFPLIYAAPPVVVFRPVIEHYQSLFTKWDFGDRIVVSLVVATAVSLFNVVVGSLAAYALSRPMFRGRQLVGVWVISQRFLPPVLFLVPFYLLCKRLGLIDTFVALIVPNLIATLPFTIWLLKSFFEEIPTGVSDAARVDGCSDLGVLWHIVLPVAKPGVSVAVVFSYLLAWNELLLPTILGRSLATVTVAFSSFRMMYHTDWGAMAAASMVCLVPLILMVFVCQRHIIRGLTMGAMSD